MTRFLWRWNIYAPVASILILVVSLSGIRWAAWLQIALWTAALSLVLGMVIMAAEAVGAHFQMDFWAEAHHGWHRDNISPNIMELAIWVGCVVISVGAALALVSVAAVQLRGFSSFPYNDSVPGQLVAVAGLAVPWVLPSHGDPVNAFGVATDVAVVSLYISNFALYLGVLLAAPGRKPREERRR